ncbi:MAG: hypothetical protein LUQ26_09600 [Methylococcaceae bacterium]|nr:hypothetical protein [Methylococcaceae bacterium]
MTVQTDVKAATVATASAMVVGRCRLKAIAFPCGATAGAILLTDGLGGKTLLSLTTAAAAGESYMLLPGEGILADTGIYLTMLTTVVSVTAFYG